MLIADEDFWSQVTTINLNNLFLLFSTIAAGAVIWKILRFIFKVDRALPTLLNIAAQFENNSGSTIRDKIEDLHANQKVIKDALDKDKLELKAADKLVLKIAEDSRLIAETNAAIVKELSETSVEDILHIKEYMHEQMHSIRNQMQQENLRGKLMSKQLERLEDRLDTILPLVNRHRQSDVRDSSPTDE